MVEQLKTPQKASSFIGIVVIAPDDIHADGTYIIECPRLARPLSVNWLGDKMLMWMITPMDDVASAVPIKRRTWVVPGGRPLSLGAHDGVYVGTVIVPMGEDTVQDWHVFFDTSDAPVSGPAQSTHTFH